MWGGDWFVQYGWGTLLGKLMEKAESTSPRGVQGQSRLTELCMERTVLPKEDNSCDLMDSDKSSDYVERLAHKYMRKCTVESSTESESESNNEGLPNTRTEGVFKKAREMLLQAIYTGDLQVTCHK
ncbi:uncharacterized protein LOC123369412 isoform X5 [Mauremys mutica]|uniref:uncharacterized protein LOC123369412 isoform X5 n=1 Tax=Mauremys mutica TaxID=74926 RepID=UPI001D166173|nr:uncharacterized protein LOC123369412 isoform X5 [Mauremys mutica]